jgi:hypothetical protein
MQKLEFGMGEMFEVLLYFFDGKKLGIVGLGVIFVIFEIFPAFFEVGKKLGEMKDIFC